MKILFSKKEQLKLKGKKYNENSMDGLANKLEMAKEKFSECENGSETCSSRQLSATKGNKT